MEEMYRRITDDFWAFYKKQQKHAICDFIKSSWVLDLGIVASLIILWFSFGRNSTVLIYVAIAVFGTCLIISYIYWANKYSKGINLENSIDQFSKDRKKLDELTEAYLKEKPGLQLNSKGKGLLYASLCRYCDDRIQSQTKGIFTFFWSTITIFVLPAVIGIIGQQKDQLHAYVIYICFVLIVALAFSVVYVIIQERNYQRKKSYYRVKSCANYMMLSLPDNNISVEKLEQQNAAEKQQPTTAKQPSATKTKESTSETSSCCSPILNEETKKMQIEKEFRKRNNSCKCIRRRKKEISIEKGKKCLTSGLDE